MPDPVHDSARAQRDGKSLGKIAVPVAEEPPRWYIKEEITAENQHLVSTLQLVRVRARAVRAMYRRMYRVLQNTLVEQFVFVSPEKEGSSTLEREEALRYHVERHVQVLELYRTRIEGDACAKRRFKLGKEDVIENKNENVGKRLRLSNSTSEIQNARMASQPCAHTESALTHSMTVVRASVPTSSIAGLSTGGAGP